MSPPLQQFFSPGDTSAQDLEAPDYQERIESRASKGTIRHSTAYLDGLRGLAALLVFLQHYFAGFAAMGMQNSGFGQDGNLYLFCTLPFIRMIWTGGHSAVTIFFVISGYVLSIGPLSKLKPGEGAGYSRWSVRKALASAVVRRPFRLYLPPLIVTALVALLLHVPGPLMLTYETFVPEQNLWEELKKYVALSVDHYKPWGYHDNDGFYLPYDVVTWTLPIELNGSMWIYGVSFVASYILGPARNIAGMFAGVLLIMAIGMLQLAYKWSGAAFTFGVILAVVDTWSLDSYGVLSALSKQTRSLIHHIFFVVGWYLLCQPTSSAEGSAHTPGWGFLTNLIPDVYAKTDGDIGKPRYYRYWGCWGAFFLVFGILRLRWLQSFFTSRPLRYLGKVSFMLYLVHVPWMRIFPDRWHSMLGGLDIFGRRSKLDWSDDWLWIPDLGPLGLNSRWIVSLLLALPTTLVLAEIATRFVDKPSIAAGERIAALVGLGRENNDIPSDKEPLTEEIDLDARHHERILPSYVTPLERI